MTAVDRPGLRADPEALVRMMARDSALVCYCLGGYPDPDRAHIVHRTHGCTGPGNDVRKAEDLLLRRVLPALNGAPLGRALRNLERARDTADRNGEGHEREALDQAIEYVRDEMGPPRPTETSTSPTVRHDSYRLTGRSLVCSCGTSWDTWYGVRPAEEHWKRHAAAALTGPLTEQEGGPPNERYPDPTAPEQAAAGPRKAVHAGMTDENRRDYFGEHPLWAPFRELHARIADAGCACTEDEGCRDHRLLDQVNTQITKRLDAGNDLFVSAEDALDRLIGGERARLEDLGQAVQQWRDARR